MLHAVTVILFAVITLGMAAALTSTTEKFFGLAFSYASLAIATAVLTIVTLPAMYVLHRSLMTSVCSSPLSSRLALEMMRPGGPTSTVIAEISWLGQFYLRARDHHN